MKILAVDDEPLFLEILEASLQELGFSDVTPIYSAREALRELEQSKVAFECILLDIRMPGTDGVELCRRIRAVPGYRRTPIMMVTAMTDREYIDDAFAAGASDYLTKPLDPLELKARMSMVERLVAEQVRNLRMEQQTDLPEGIEDLDLNAEDLQFQLETPLVLQGFDRVIEYSALENYLLSLGIKDSYGASVFAISIRNAARIFENTNSVGFLNVLHDVGVIIESVLQSAKALVSYAGNGVFVAVLGDRREPDVQRVEDLIRNRLRDFDEVYAAERLPAPIISVGPAVHKSLFTRPGPAQMLQSAIAAVGTAHMVPPRNDVPLQPAV